jgi:uncharacterized protein YndB with AHSA1/START domain
VSSPATPAGDEVTKTLRIAARPETVWRYWTDPQRMAAWWGNTVQVDLRPGGTCRVETGGPVMAGTFLELVPFERLVFSFGWEPGADAPPIPPGSTRVEVTFQADGDDTVLTLRHSGLPPGLGELHLAGWEHHLPNLVAAATSTTTSTNTPTCPERTEPTS